MLKFVKAFLIFTILYHILVTTICYGIFGGQYQEVFSLVRDGLWIAFILVAVISQRRHCKAFLRTRKYPLISFGILLVFGIGISKLIGKGRNDIFIGIKYGFRYLGILFSAVFVGYSLAEKKQEAGLTKFLRIIVYVLLAIVAIGFLRQGAKLLFPDWFMQIGYGPLNDFFYGVKPPLYYLTGFEGTLRWQGIFAGPNNYGYFLVAFLPLLLLRVQSKRKLRELLGIGLWVAAIILTLSRSAYIGGLLVFALVYRKWIIAHKKRAIGLLVLVVLGIIGLSVLKGTSTLAHITAKFTSLSYVINQPLGYGLGSSGPAVHHNGTMLPENYFIQLMIDIGTVGFLMWIFCVSQVGAITRAIKKAEHSSIIYGIRKGLMIGWIALLVMGMFLHVFEDSMVNYLFFILRGITTGFLSYGLKGVKIGLRDFWRRK